MTNTLIDSHVKIRRPSKSTIKYVLGLAKKRGIDGFIYAGHTNLADVKEFIKSARRIDEEITVFQGLEVRAIKTEYYHLKDVINNYTHFWGELKEMHQTCHALILGIEEQIPHNLLLEDLLDITRNGSMAVIAAHPFAPYFLNWGSDLMRFSDDIHALEYNMDHTIFLQRNLKAVKTARELRKPTVYASYCHLPETIGMNATVFHEDITDTEDLIRALKNRVRTERRTTAIIPRLLGSIRDVTWEFYKKTG